MSKFDRNSAPVSRPDGTRLPVSASHLQYIVETELARHLQAGKSFTAHSITLALRDNFPRLEIVHTRVRKIVQARMAKLALPYRQRMQRHEGKWAMTYIPAAVSVMPTRKGLVGTRQASKDYGTPIRLLSLKADS